MTQSAQRKFLAQQRSEAIRNKPPAKNQLRNQMMTYLMHVGNYKHAELKIKKFEEVQALYEKIKRSDEDLISIGSAEDEKLIKRMNEKGVGLSKSEVIKEESKEEVQKDNKDEEMKKRSGHEIIRQEKYPIKEWKTECLGAKPQTDQAEHLEEINLNMVIRSNGQKRYFSTLMTVLSIFNREDLNAVYQLVMDKYQDEMPEVFNRVLWGDLMVLFNSDDKDMFWSSQIDGIISFSKKHRVHKEYVSKQGRKFAKGESSVQRDPLLDEMPEDKVDHMETENAQSEGRTREMMDGDKESDEARLSTEDEVSTVKEGVSTDFEKLSTDRPIVSTDGSKVSTDMQVEGAEDQVKGTDEHNEGTEDKNEGTEEQREGTEEKVESTDGQVKGTEDQTEEEIDTQATQTSTQTPTSMIFGDDETIAKNKGKKKIEEEDESKSESDGIPQAEKKFKQLESDEELARKVQEEWETEEERNRIAEEKAANEEA
ncbi:hypothetical protein Tco_0968499 [Tanacetum coccineum]